MRGGGRIVGLVIIAIAVLLFLGGSAVVFSSGADKGGIILGVFALLLVCAPLVGVGLYLQRQGSQEQSQFAQVEKEKKLLNMVLTQGQVSISEIVAEMQQPTDEVEEMIRNLVGKQLFSGAINWDKGVLYSVDSQSLTDGKKCPNCGDQIAFAGKGLIACPSCGSEVFLTKRAAASTGQ